MPWTRRRRDRFWVRWLLLALGLGLIGIGYGWLSVEPSVSADEAAEQAFTGMALVTLGAAIALLSRWL